MGEEFEETSFSKVSKINAAALINLIMADLWKDAYRHSRNAELSKWNADLNCIWIELAGDVDADGDKEKEFKKLDSNLASTGSLYKKASTGFKQTSKDELVLFAKQYRLLMEKALFLKRLQNKQGKGTAYYDDADDYMD